mgnify:CR=1 FL=1
MKRNQIILLILFGMLINGTTLLSQITYSGKGEVVAVRFLELKDDVDVAEFEKFAVEEFNSTFDGAVPGLKQYISKSDRGIAVDSYAMLMIFDSQHNPIHQRAPDTLCLLYQHELTSTIFSRCPSPPTNGFH